MEATVLPLTEMRFAWPWRPYQQRVLDALDAHLADRRLHVVAAPGSGKTILGLEAVRRLGRPAVILSPTTTIRDQWLARLRDFLPDGTPVPPPWAGSDLTSPAFLTSITYQSLHTQFRSGQSTEEDEDDTADDRPPGANELGEVIELLRAADVGTLVLDEAHHLRQEWWKALTALIDALPDVTVVSLTATPPYDVVGLEWQRYEKLCGPIDEEISVPELVKSGTLCPHQDYVWAVQLSDDRARRIADHDAQVERLISDLLENDDLLRAVEQHPWLDANAGDDAAAEVLGAPEFAVAMLVYLQARGRPLPERLLELLDTRAAELPPTAKRWWQVLLERYLRDESWRADGQREQHRDALARRLRNDGLLYRRDLRLLRSRPIERVLSQAAQKIDACLAIHDLESQMRGDGLKQVILTDFIRDETLKAAPVASDATLGAFPIFQALVAHVGADRREGLALLTGRMVILHERHLAALNEELRGSGSEAASVQPLADSLAGFVRVNAPCGGRIVDAMTGLLARGLLHVLVGTRALLGEGWDAPAVNSLVLASYVGSYVLTNQMRGRALRKDPAQPDKIASIWHVAAVAPQTPSGWDDVTGLERRFDAFIGLAACKPLLESGVARLALPLPESRDWVARVNAEMQQRLAAHGEVAARWQAAIATEDEGRVVPGVRTARPPRLRRFTFYNTLRYVLAAALSTFVAVFSSVMQSARADNARVFLWVLTVGGVAAFALSLPGLIRAGVLALRHLPVDGSVRAIAMALYEALRDAGHISAGPAARAVCVAETAPGVFSISLAGRTFRESAIFADSLAEMLGPVENPRYLLTRPDLGRRKRRPDFHAVPQLLGINKQSAAALHAAWRRRLGGGDLIYTRTADGRRTLLRARARAFSSSFADPPQRLDRWQ